MEAQTKETEQALQDLCSAFIRNNWYAMERATGLVQEQARAKHKFRTISGNAEASIETDVIQNEDGTEGFVEINPAISAYPIFLHEGTGLYGPKGKAFDIFPKNKKMLRFLTSPGTAKFRFAPYGRFHEGGFTFAFGVTNPGIKGDPFVYNALEAKTKDMEKVFQDYTDKTIKEAGFE